MAESNTEQDLTQQINANLQEGNQQAQEEPGEERQFTADEQTAYDHGWRPKDEYEGSPDDWISAKEFNRRSSLFARIAKYGNENKELRESVKKLFSHNRRLYDAGYAKAMQDLKAQRATAIEDGDTRKLVQIEDEIDGLKEEHTRAIQEFDESVAAPKQGGIPPEQALIFENWLDANPWYQKNAQLTLVADSIAKELVEKSAQVGKPIEYGKLLNEVAREVRKNNPDFFSSNREPKTGGVDGGSRGTKRPGNTGGKYSLSSIPEEERVIARTIMQDTGMTEEQYVKQYTEAKRG